MLFLLPTIGYFPFAFWDETIGAIKSTESRLQEAHEKELNRRREAHARERERVTQQNKNRGKGES